MLGVQSFVLTPRLIRHQIQYMGGKIERAPPPPDIEDGVRVGSQVCNSPHVTEQDH
jgi:hypothetical protein